MIELLFDVGDKLRGEMANHLPFWHVVSDQTVGVFHGGFLPRTMGLTWVDGQRLDVGQASELAALIGD